MSGWAKIHRKMNGWEWKKKPLTFALFVHLITNANHREGRWQGTTIKRGQIITGREQLASETGLSIQQVRTALNHLKSTSDITIETNQKFSIITINNYESYQDGNQQDNQQPTSNQPVNNQQSTTNKNEKKGRRKEKKIAARPADVPENIWDDFTSQRTKDFTETGLTGIRNEALKAGWTLEAALAECCSRGWQGFKADWVMKGKGNESNRSGSKGKSATARESALSGYLEATGGNG